MNNLLSIVSLTVLFLSAVAHDHHVENQIPLDYVKFPYQAVYQGGGGEGRGLLSICLPSYSPQTFYSVTADAIFSGITTFAKLPWVQCLTREKDVPFDIAFIGAPFVSQELPITFLKVTDKGPTRTREHHIAQELGLVLRVSVPALDG